MHTIVYKCHTQCSKEQFG